MRFHKYHALGNDYLVLDPADFPGYGVPTSAQTRVICHRNYGVGADGILWGPVPADDAPFGLRIFNPDGSEAEKSGNGLRIFARYLHDQRRVGIEPFTIATRGGVVGAVVEAGGGRVRIDMGRVSFDSERIPVVGPRREVLNETLRARDRDFTFCAATIGNPHCVIPLAAVDETLARTYGPVIEALPLFPNRTNVQFLQVLDRASIRIEIWERGAGYTLASGSSSSAAAAVAHRLGLVDREVAVHVPGGEISIEIGEAFAVRMSGAVTRVAEGLLHPELFSTSV
jgi:diaminopimelate epimerase